MAVKQIYVKASDEDLWNEAQAACKRQGIALSGVLADFLRHWVKRVGTDQHWLLAVDDKSPSSVIEQLRFKLAELEDMVVPEEAS